VAIERRATAYRGPTRTPLCTNTGNSAQEVRGPWAHRPALGLCTEPQRTSGRRRDRSRCASRYPTSAPRARRRRTGTSDRPARIRASTGTTTCLVHKPELPHSRAHTSPSHPHTALTPEHLRTTRPTPTAGQRPKASIPVALRARDHEWWLLRVFHYADQYTRFAGGTVGHSASSSV